MYIQTTLGNLFQRRFVSTLAIDLTFVSIVVVFFSYSQIHTEVFHCAKGNIFQCSNMYYVPTYISSSSTKCGLFLSCCFWPIYFRHCWLFIAIVLFQSILVSCEFFSQVEFLVIFKSCCFVFCRFDIPFRGFACCYLVLFCQIVINVCEYARASTGRVIVEKSHRKVVGEYRYKYIYYLEYCRLRYVRNDAWN